MQLLGTPTHGYIVLLDKVPANLILGDVILLLEIGIILSSRPVDGLLSCCCRGHVCISMVLCMYYFVYDLWC